jgi:hypothetical protein
MKQMQMKTSIQISTRHLPWAVAKKTGSDCDSNGKHVTWCPVEESCHSIMDPYTGIPIDDIWYSREELKQLRIHNEMIVSDSHKMNHKGATGLETPLVTFRGLETWTDQGEWERFQNHRDCVHRVLDEQDRQRGIDKSEFQYSPYPMVKRANHLHIPFDHERLAALCRDVTSKARRMASLRGKQDHEAAVKADSIKASFEDMPLEDNDTVTTESPTDSDDSSVEDNIMSTYRFPPVVRCNLPHLTPAILEEKKKARYAAYLMIRQHRIAARERADFEWEQRRLQRRDSIRLEADTSINQLKRILSISDEFVELIAASRSI